jgi:hypothetical protein
MTTNVSQTPSFEDHQKAFTEVAFLLDIFASTIDNIMGGATASVGRFAGRGMAAKWPIDLDHPTLRATLDVVSERMKSGFDITCTERENVVDVTFEKCVIRDVCRARSLELGGPLCKLFHSYFDGVVNEIVCRPVKSEMTQANGKCTLCMKVQ